MKLSISRDTAKGAWHWYVPLPAGAEIIGTVQREHEKRRRIHGALIRLASGVYVQGLTGVIRSLDQAEVERGLKDAPR